MSSIFSQLLSGFGGGGSLGGLFSGVGPTGPQVPLGGVEATNEFANQQFDPRALSALGFLGGGLTSMGGGQPNPAAVSPGLLQMLGQSQKPAQLTGSSGLTPAKTESNTGILQLLAALGR